ncbi:hypothetical protein EII35_14760, partial [Arachnia propionica]
SRGLGGCLFPWQSRLLHRWSSRARSLRRARVETSAGFPISSSSCTVRQGSRHGRRAGACGPARPAEKKVVNNAFRLAADLTCLCATSSGARHSCGEEMSGLVCWAVSGAGASRRRPLWVLKQHQHDVLVTSRTTSRNPFVAGGVCLPDLRIRDGIWRASSEASRSP